MNNVSKGVNDLMGGYILHTRTDDFVDKGISIGRKDSADLINHLWSNGRGEEAQRAAKDSDLLDQLLKEYQEKKEYGKLTI